MKKRQVKRSTKKSKNPTTIGGWLKLLPEPYRSKALENCKNPTVRACDMSDALMSAFSWGLTAQGFEYWHDVKTTYADLKR